MRLLITLLLSILLAFNTHSENLRGAEVINYAQNIIAESENYTLAYTYMIENKDAFDKNNTLDMFWWNHYTGAYAYFGENDSLAVSCFSVCIDIINNEKLGKVSKQNAEILKMYYWITQCKSSLQYPIEAIYADLLNAKRIYEQVELHDTEFYKLIYNDIKTIERIQSVKILVSESLEFLVKEDYNNAIPKYESLLELLDKNSYQDKIVYAGYAKQLAGCYVSVFRLEEAESLYLSTINELKSIGAEKELIYGALLDGLSVLYMQTFDYEKAWNYASEAKSVYEINKHFESAYVKCMSNCAMTLNYLGNKAWAKIFSDETLRISGRLSNDESILDLIKNYSDKEVNENLLSTASFLSSTITPKILMLSNASIINEGIGCTEDAIQLMQDAIAIEKQYGINSFYTTNNLGYLYFKQMDYLNASQYFNKAMTLANSTRKYDYASTSYAISLFLANDTSSAKIAQEVSSQYYNHLKNEFLFLNDKERDLYWNEFKATFILLNSAIFQNDEKKYFGSIYDNVLRYKGLLVKSSNRILESIRNSNDSELLSKYYRFLDLKLKKNDNNDSLNILEEEIVALERYLQNHVSFLKNDLNWVDIKKNLNDGELAVEFANIPTFNAVKDKSYARYCAILLTKDSDTPVIIPLFFESELDSISTEDYYTTSKLYDIVWKPIFSYIGDNYHNVYFSPDRYLSSISLENTPINIKDSVYLSDRYNMIRVSSTIEIIDKKNRSKFPNIALFGGIKYKIDLSNDTIMSRFNLKKSNGNKRKRGGLDDIYQSTLSEVNGISKILRDNKINHALYTQEMASKQAIMKLSGNEDNITILHIATHGFSWSEDSETTQNSILSNIGGVNFGDREKYLGMSRSCLLFSGAYFDGTQYMNSNGILSGSEIENLDLSGIEMVVLSACQTGLGYEDAIEGVYGLQRAFKKAGVKSLLMTLWEVDDDATRLFMINFYENLIKLKSKHMALKEAQKFIQEYEHGIYADPYYWAGFVLLDAID